MARFGGYQGPALPGLGYLGLGVVVVAVGGTVLWRKKLPYAEILQKNLPKLEQDESLRALMEKTLHTVQAAIAKGKLA